MGGGKSKEKKPDPPPKKTPCEAGGDNYCKKKSNAKGCQNKGSDNYICKCAEGYKEMYENDYSECHVIDKCLDNNGGCDKHATCTNRVALSPTCRCKSPYWEDASDTPGQKCKEVDMCGKDHGGCDKHSNCIARKGKPPLCKCLDGFKGGTKPGDKCEDVDECANTEAPPCGKKEQHATCKNTVGSYTCKCDKGYEGTGFKGDCKQIKYCSDPKLNDCDPVFAYCELKDGSYACKCKTGLEGDGTKGFCTVGPRGDQNAYCKILGIACNEYQTCKPISAQPGQYECVAKPKQKQLSTFFSAGPSPNTPTWVWGVVAVGSVLLLLATGYLIYWLYKRSQRKAYNELAEDAMYGGGADYGAMSPAPGYG